MIDIAYAMAQQPAGDGPAAPWYMSMLPMVLIFGVFYFLLIRPQQQKAKDRDSMLSGLKKGDAVITSGGIYGQIVGVADNVLTVEIADKVRIRVARGYVAGLASDKTTEGGPISPG